MNENRNLTFCCQGFWLKHRCVNILVQHNQHNIIVDCKKKKFKKKGHPATTMFPMAPRCTSLQTHILLKEALLLPTPCVNTYLFCFHPHGGRRLHSHTQKQTDSSGSRQSTFTLFAPTQRFDFNSFFGNCCSTSKPSIWHFQGELEKKMSITFKPRRTLVFEKTMWNLKGFACSVGHKVADSHFMQENQ